MGPTAEPAVVVDGVTKTFLIPTERRDTLMERALHPKLAKRMVWADSAGKSHLVDLTALELIQGTKAHPPVPAAETTHRQHNRQAARS